MLEPLLEPTHNLALKQRLGRLRESILIGQTCKLSLDLQRAGRAWPSNMTRLVGGQSKMTAYLVFSHDRRAGKRIRTDPALERRQQGEPKRPTSCLICWRKRSWSPMSGYGEKRVGTQSRGILRGRPLG